MQFNNKLNAKGLQNLTAPVLATWLWDVSFLEKTTEELIFFLQQKSVNKVYVQIDPSVASLTYGNFIEAAGIADIQVYAMDGSPDWVSVEGYKSLSVLTAWFSHHQQLQPPNRKFSGLHLDIEPYLYSEWDKQRTTIIYRYQTLLVQARHFADSVQVSLEADLPFWFDEITYENFYGSGTLAEWAISLCDSITLMAYRDSACAIIEIVKTKMFFGNKYKKPVLIGVETEKSTEGDYVSFFEEGESYMISQLHEVDLFFASYESYGGLGIHHMNSWKSLRP